MALSSGTNLGPYEIQSPLGAGGMGEVYRARDTRLNRDVAIKVLPAAYARDPERLRRFQQEAQAVAALNHPNILAIHIDALPTNSATGAPRMSPAEVVGYLEKLPSIAWPYGLVVAVQETGVRGLGDDAQIRKNREELQRLLTEAGVKLELWPSA